MRKLGISIEVAEYLLKNAKAQVKPGPPYGSHGKAIYAWFISALSTMRKQPKCTAASKTPWHPLVKEMAIA
jgi:hypothetical protein